VVVVVVLLRLGPDLLEGGRELLQLKPHLHQ
jgi:hypothetical protein